MGEGLEGVGLTNAISTAAIAAPPSYGERMSSAIRFSSVTLACPDPGGLAAFYADVMGGEVTFVHNEEWASMPSEGARLEFMGVVDYG